MDIQRPSMRPLAIALWAICLFYYIIFAGLDVPFAQSADRLGSLASSQAQGSGD